MRRRRPLDKAGWRAFNERVAETWTFGNRVVIEDLRDNGTYLRVTWHPDGRTFVVSHWRDDVCLAATRVDPSAAPDLIALLARGLGDVAAANVTTARVEAGRRSSTGRWKRIQRAITERLRPPRRGDERDLTDVTWRRSA